MSRQLEQVREDRQAKKDGALLLALDGGLVEAVASAGATLLGVSISFGGSDCLLVIKAELAGRRQIAFVGSTDAQEAIIKAVREAKGDKLKWRADKFIK